MCRPGKVRAQDASVRRYRVKGFRLQTPRLTLIFFFQAEDGIRDLTVTGVQTCALPILPPAMKLKTLIPLIILKKPCERKLKNTNYYLPKTKLLRLVKPSALTKVVKIGRASCRERV